MGAPRRKLRGAFVLLAIGLPALAWAGPQLRVGDCGVLGEDSSMEVQPSPLAGPSPSSSPNVDLQAGQAVRILAVKNDRVLVEPIAALSVCKVVSKVLNLNNQGWIASASIRYAKLATVRGVKSIVVMPERLKAYGKAYTSAKICANHLFTESASFYFTGDEKLPLAVLCTGELDGEPNTLSVLGPKEALRSKTIDSKESSSSIDDATLVKELDSLIRAQGQ